MRAPSHPSAPWKRTRSFGEGESSIYSKREGTGDAGGRSSPRAVSSGWSLPPKPPALLGSALLPGCPPHAGRYQCAPARDRCSRRRVRSLSLAALWRPLGKRGRGTWGADPWSQGPNHDAKEEVRTDRGQRGSQSGLRVPAPLRSQSSPHHAPYEARWRMDQAWSHGC